MGGEKPSIKPLWTRWTGSPPRGRGKEDKPAHYCELSRITPAWAGKRHPFLNLRWWVGDHPRVGGEKDFVVSVDFCSLGSPPRGRGKDALTGAFPVSARITPAWAGKRAQSRNLATRVQDHPRVGGEKTSISFTSKGTKGSPPRGRGKGCLCDLLLRCYRITPAWAGKSCFLHSGL